MKFKGSVAFFVGLTGILPAYADNQCSRLFDVPKMSVSQSQSLVSQYLKATMQISKTNYEPQSRFETKDLFDKKKLELIKKYSSTLEQLISKGEISIQDIAKSKFLLAEALSEGTFHSHSYVMMANNKIYSLDLKGNGYKILNESKFGYQKNSPMIQYLRLERDLVMLIINDSVLMFDRAQKDPILLAALAKSQKSPSHIAELYKSHRAELEEILTHTTITINALMSSSSLKTTTEKGEAVHILTLEVLHKDGNNGSLNLYFTQRGNIVEHTNAKRWGSLEFSSQMGFETQSPLKLKAKNGVDVIVENGTLKFSNEAKAINLILSMNAVLKDSETSSFRNEFMSKYGEVVQKLIQSNYFAETNFHEIISKLDVVVNSRGNQLYVLPSKQGEIYFKIDQLAAGKLADISIKEYGKTFYTSNGEKIELGQSVGFLSQAQTKRLQTDNENLNQEALKAKISVAIQSEVTPKQAAVLTSIQAKLKGAEASAQMPISKMSTTALVGLAVQVKADLLKGEFTNQQADEVIKVLF